MFDTSFKLFLADSSGAELAHHRVRYQVFCRERGFEDPEAFCSSGERDDWDERAAKFVVADKQTGNWVGACRLILPDVERFPVETLGCDLPECAQDIPRQQIAEVSRVCVSKTPYDALPMSANMPFLADIGSVSSRQESEVHVGLIRATIFYGLEHGIRYVYMLVTLALQRLLARLGVVFLGTGSEVEHRGTRVPCLVDLEASRTMMSRKSEQVSGMMLRKALAYQSHAAMTAAQRAHVVREGLQPGDERLVAV